jgi:hypothetical protein
MAIFRIFLFTYFFALFLASCGITYKVRNTKNELEEVLYFPCGHITFALEGAGNSKFKLKQRFDLSERIELYADSLQVIYNGKALPGNRISKGLATTDGIVEITQNERFEFGFELEEGVFDGDTIAIYAPDFIKCSQDFITLDTVFYTFENRLRIYGVNAL